jgi:hypothetical protein
MTPEPFRPKYQPRLQKGSLLGKPERADWADGADDVEDGDRGATPAVPGAEAASTGRRFSPQVIGASAAAVLAAVVFFNIQGQSGGTAPETGSANWAAQVAPTNDAYRNDHGKPIRHVDSRGNASYGSTVTVSADDRDDATTRAVALALRSGNPAAAEAAIQQAQKIPDTRAAVATVKPSLSPGLLDDLARPGTAFYRVYLNDSCDEDGDVVELRIGGQTFAVVPIDHKGVTLSVPVPASGSTRVSIVGVKDGGGGITVGCRTSEGNYFCRSLAEGEEQTVGIAAR